MPTAEVFYQDPANPQGPHLRAEQDPHPDSPEEGRRWCETFARAHWELKVENAMVSSSLGRELHGFYNRRTKTWRWV